MSSGRSRLGFLRWLDARRLGDAVAWLALGVATLVVLWPLGLTNRVLAGIDALTYFTPYWAHRNAALQAGQLPLWNPYLFLGVPFLANIQSAVLYPLHWPLIGLPAERALIWSAVLHIWLSAGLCYTFGRRSLGLHRLPAFLCGGVFAFGGYSLARVENINQLNALAWLPALFWILDEAARARGWRGRLRWSIALSAAIALQILAGHTQSAFISLLGLACYAVAPPLLTLLIPAARRGDRWRRLVRPLANRLLPLLAVGPALALTAAQLLPSLELNALGLRSAGLTFSQTVSFSLRPRLLLQSLLPPYQRGLEEAFGSEGYAEFMGYAGIVALTLAFVGIMATVRRYARSQGEADPPRDHCGALVVLGLLGLLLALGAYDPLTYLLWRFVPGFDLFRAPVRWLALIALAAAVLAGCGLQAWLDLARRVPHGLPAALRRRPRWPAWIALAACVALGALSRWPAAATWLLWLALAGVTCALLWWGRSRARPVALLLVLLALVELWAAARAMPFTLATAPLATKLRNAPSALLGATGGGGPGEARVLSLSDIRFDPGDLAELRELQAGRIEPAAVERMVRAVKQIEVLAPNTPLLFRLPAVDGYDGGMLPLGRYAGLLELFLPPELRLPDGRLAEQLRQIPPDRLLDLTGVRFIITDKQNDLWIDDVYYDLEQTVELMAGQTLTLRLPKGAGLSATAVGLVTHLTREEPGGQIATVTFTGEDGGGAVVPLSAPQDSAWLGAGAEAPARVARPWPEWMGQGRDYVTTRQLQPSDSCTPSALAQAAVPPPACALTPVIIQVSASPSLAGALVLRGLSLIDQRTGAHESVTLSASGSLVRIHSGDVKIYERRDSPGRAWLVHGWQDVPGDAEALASLASAGFDPRSQAVVAGIGSNRPGQPSLPGEQVAVDRFTAEEVSLKVTVAADALLVLADSDYPGWVATVDGVESPILRANLLFRGVLLEPGDHKVVFTYRPASWRVGSRISLAALLLSVCALVSTLRRQSRLRPSP